MVAMTARRDIEARAPTAHARAGRRPCRRAFGAMVAAAIALGAVVVGIQVLTSTVTPSPDSCTVASLTGARPFELAPAQAQDAATIGAVALKKGLSDHAVTIALAASLQEAKLYNLPYGDLDSVGLFQQRPSQGWGTTSQLLDPIYATAAFYDRLVEVPGWQTMPVTDAAQSVQRSAAPTAYATWEPEARAIAVALTGEVPADLSCRLRHFQGAPPSPAALTLAADEEMGPGLLTGALSEKAGWWVATWAVAHAWAYHLSAVSFARRQWTPASGAWRISAPAGSPSATDRVVIVP
jgi:hypothetical protein